MMHGADDSEQTPKKAAFKGEKISQHKNKAKTRCPYCDEEHWLNQRESFSKMSKAEMFEWIKANRRCWRCARPHKASDCTLKKKCGQCKSTHLNVLHEVNHREREQPAKTVVNHTVVNQKSVDIQYIDPPKSGNTKVMLKIVRVHLHNQGKVFDTYAVLDDGSERTLLLSSAANHLGIQGQKESLSLRTIRRDIKVIDGEQVTFTISPASECDAHRCSAGQE